jgi:hypothetical protein
VNDGAVNPLLWPAVWLMNQLRYPRKFTLTTGLLAIPLALTLLLWLAEIHERIAFAEKERTGLAYVSAVHGLLEPLLLRREVRWRGVKAIDSLDRTSALRSGPPNLGSAGRSMSGPLVTRSSGAGSCSPTQVTPEPDPRPRARQLHLMDALVTRLPNSP